MKVRIYEDELYPFYGFPEQDEQFNVQTVDIPDEKVNWIRKTMKEFDAVQKYLRGAYEGKI